jgi:dienelactone hydrolase
MPFPDDGRSVMLRSTLVLDGAETPLEWTLPASAPVAVLTLEHGYARSCRRLRGTAQRIAAAGIVVLCVDASMARGNPALADALAAAMARDLRGPNDAPLPQRIIVSGHSVGAAFAARLGARLDALAPQRLAGALLFDPVAVDGFAADLQSISRAGVRPVWAVTATAAGCNAQHNAYPALRAVRATALAAARSGFVGVELSDGSTHADVEGEDTDGWAVLACGRPLPLNTELVRTLAARWAAEMAADDVQTTPPTPASTRAIE